MLYVGSRGTPDEHGDMGYLSAGVSMLRVWNGAVAPKDVDDFRYASEQGDVLRNVRYPPHPKLTNLVAYQDGAMLRELDPILGFWTPRDRSTQLLPAPQPDSPLASNSTLSDYIYLQSLEFIIISTPT